MYELNSLNYWALLVAWLINISFGAFWYSPAGFGKLWTRLSGIDMMKMPKDKANKAITFVTLSAIFQSFALRIIINSLHAVTLFDGMLTGSILWAGFAAATTIGITFYLQLNWKFWWLNSSFFLIVMLVNSAILAV